MHGNSEPHQQQYLPGLPPGDDIKEDFLYMHSNPIKSPCKGRLRLNSNSYHLAFMEICQAFTGMKQAIFYRNATEV